MELNKRKSLLTPASPTCWGQIHGDISKQSDLVDVIKEQITNLVANDLIHKIKGEILSEINPLISNITETTQPRLETGVNIKSLSGRTLLGEGDLDPLEASDRELLNSVSEKADYGDVQSALQKASTAQNIAISATNSVDELRGYVDEQIGGINTITDDIIGV